MTPRRAKAARPGLVAGLLVAAALAFGAFALVGSWQDVRASIMLLSPVDLAASSAAAAAGMLMTGLSWRFVLLGLGERLPIRPALTLFTAAQLGKYVPGAIWVVAIQTDLGRRRNIPAGVMALSYVAATGVAVGTGAVMGLVSLGDPRLPLAPWILVAAALGGSLVLAGLVRPSWINRLMTALARLVRRDVPVITMEPKSVAWAVVLECSGWVLLGAHIWLLARPLGASTSLVPVAIGGFALAFVAGLVLIPVPAGVGVREGLLVALLAPSLGAGQALTVALLSRLVLVVVDLALAASTGALGLAWKVRAARGEARSSENEAPVD